MTNVNRIPEELLNQISGGALPEGWESAVLQMMQLYKDQFGNRGKDILKEFFIEEGIKTDPSLEPADISTINAFIDANW